MLFEYKSNKFADKTIELDPITIFTGNNRSGLEEFVENFVAEKDVLQYPEKSRKKPGSFYDGIDRVLLRSVNQQLLTLKSTDKESFMALSVSFNAVTGYFLCRYVANGLMIDTRSNSSTQFIEVQESDQWILRILAILLPIYNAVHIESIVLLSLIEVGLDPCILSNLVERLKKVSVNSKKVIVVSTYSLEILNKFDKAEIRVVNKNPQGLMVIEDCL